MTKDKNISSNEKRRDYSNFVPELRFPEFESEWECKNIGEISKTYSGGTPRTSIKEYYEGDIPFIKSGEINSDTTEQFVSEWGVANSSAQYVNKGDLLLALYGTGTCGEAAISKLDGAINQAVLKIDNEMNNIFQYNYFLREKDSIVHKYIQGGQGNLSAKIIKNLDFYFPTIEEQNKIANFLEVVDKKTALLEESLNSYQNYYKCVSNNYFDNLSGDNIVRFKDIISKGKAGGTPKSSNRAYYNGEIPFLSINDMTTQGKYIDYTTKTITEEGLNNSSAWTIPKNSLLYSIYASIGFVSINRIELTTSQAIYGVILKENINQDFIYHYLKNFKRHIYKYIETGTQGNLNSKIVNDIPIKLPSDDEQKTYADFFNKFDDIIEIKLKEIDKLKEFKRGLLQKMFI